MFFGRNCDSQTILILNKPLRLKGLEALKVLLFLRKGTNYHYFFELYARKNPTLFF